ncbi:MAG: diacylglycerol/lipid kinase family protein [Acidimicrobiales bacterium]
MSAGKPLELIQADLPVLVVSNAHAALDHEPIRRVPLHPNAGIQDIRHPLAGRVCDLLGSAGFEVVVIEESTADGMVSHLANELSGNDGSPEQYAAVAALGGDGTVSMVAATMAHLAGKLPMLPSSLPPLPSSGSLATLSGPAPSAVHSPSSPPSPAAPFSVPPLLLIPGGTGNSVYRSIWNDSSWEDIIYRMGEPGGNGLALRYIDLGWIKELHTSFILGASAGIFSAILEEALSMTGISGRARYEQAAMRAVGTFEPFEAEIRVDGSGIAAGRFALVAVGGARHRGGTLPILPLSDLADGMLDVCAVPAASRDDLMGALLKVAGGEHLGQPGVGYAKGSTIEIVSQAPLLLEHDGEIDRTELRECHITVVPGAVPLVSPLVPMAE